MVEWLLSHQVPVSGYPHPYLAECNPPHTMHSSAPVLQQPRTHLVHQHIQLISIYSSSAITASAELTIPKFCDLVWTERTSMEKLCISLTN